MTSSQCRHSIHQSDIHSVYWTRLLARHRVHITETNVFRQFARHKYSDVNPRGQGPDVLLLLLPTFKDLQIATCYRKLCKVQKVMT